MSYDPTPGVSTGAPRQVPPSGPDAHHHTVPPRTHGPLRRALLSAVVGIAAYYGARTFGASPTGALIASAAASAIRIAWVALRDKRIDAIAGFILFLDASTIAVGLITRSPFITLISEHISGVVFAVWVFGGLVLRRPVTETIVAWVRPGWVEQHIDRNTWSTCQAQAYYRAHMRLSLGVAVLHTAHLVAIAVIILTMPIDAAKGLLAAMALGVNVTIPALLVVGLRRFFIEEESNRSQRPDDPST
ncbi:hypothetical protein H7J06_02155 [Mycobacterium hodleri]|uniref:VC0807 family protein n=1 Tax=Mycolicibacterium hodleri TaxID=49897 RepID=UPI0021F25D5A|nr:VC0807 family protein [Mycolicibacterium hodleri]MCV7131776.1 hypothetical protein [Mycolicibacterium hodleri]